MLHSFFGDVMVQGHARFPLEGVGNVVLIEIELFSQGIQAQVLAKMIPHIIIHGIDGKRMLATPIGGLMRPPSAPTRIAISASK